MSFPDPHPDTLPAARHTPGLRWIVFYTAVSLVFVLLFNLSRGFQFWSLLALMPFMHGISSFKINALLFYTVLLGLMLVCASPAAVLSAKKLKQWLAVIIGGASVTALATFFQVLLKFDLPPGSYAYFFSGGQNTINDLSHTHTTKIVMYYLCRMLGLEAVSERLDVALPLVAHVHPALALAHGALILCVLALLLAGAYTVMRQWQARHYALVFPLYVFSSAHCIKCLIDGGPCAYDFMPALVCLHLLLSARDGQSLQLAARRYGLSYCCLLLLAPLVTTWICFDSAGLLPVLGMLFHACLYGAGFLLLAEKGKPAASVIGACCVYCLFYFSTTAVDDIMAFSQRLEKFDRVTRFTYPLHAGPKTEARAADVSRDLRGKSIREAYEELGESPLRNRNTAIAQHREAQQDVRGFIFGLVVIRGRKTVHLAPDEYISVGSVIASQRIKSAVLMRVTFSRAWFPSLWQPGGSIITENNRFAALYYLDYYLKKNGIEEYILIPFNFVEQAAP